jgi:hypothetical protein
VGDAQGADESADGGIVRGEWREMGVCWHTKACAECGRAEVGFERADGAVASAGRVGLAERDVDVSEVARRKGGGEGGDAKGNAAVEDAGPDAGADREGEQAAWVWVEMMEIYGGGEGVRNDVGGGPVGIGKREKIIEANTNEAREVDARGECA